MKPRNIQSVEHLPFKYPAVRPELPPMDAWLPFAQTAYDANWFTNFGTVSRALERRLAERWGSMVTAVVCAANATMALAAPLIAHRIEGPILLPAFTFPATLSAVRMVGAIPVLMDVDPSKWHVTPQTLKQALQESGARAAMVLAPFGLQTDFREHAAIARAADAILVIDNAPGLGLARSGLEAEHGIYEVYSLHATKPFGIGEGGAVFANRAAEARLRSALNFGLPDFGASGGPAWGLNGKMSELQAAVGMAVFRDFTLRVSRRQHFARRYQAALADLPDLRYPIDPESSVWQVFPVSAPSKATADAIVLAGRERGLEVRRYYRPSLSQLVSKTSRCPIADDLAERMCCFPVYSSSDGSEVKEVVALAREALSS